jgi:sugar O-acyltransferase (sialic acid O-acetyltransferase NeuD family)
MISLTTKGILIFGASGHAKVVIDLIEKTGVFSVHALFDDNVLLRGENIYGYQVMGGKNDLLQMNLLEKHPTVIAIGSNLIRVQIATWLTANGGHLSDVIIHPSSQLARGVTIGVGSVVMAGVVINSDSRIGSNAIVNTGAVIDHDCVIGDAVHIAPGVTLCGGIKVGDNTLIGAGAVIHPNVRIGKNVTIGAGATVLNDIEDGLTVVGTPAKPIRCKHEN